MVESGIKYISQSKLYIWKRRKNKTGETNKVENKNIEIQNYEAKLNGNKLRDLAWSLDVLDLNKHRDMSN